MVELKPQKCFGYQIRRNAERVRDERTLAKEKEKRERERERDEA